MTFGARRANGDAGVGGAADGAGAGVADRARGRGFGAPGGAGDAGAQGWLAVAVPGVRADVSGLRRAAPGVARAGRMGTQDVRGLRRAAGGVSGARGDDDAGAVGGGAVEVHGGVRVAGDRLVARGERACGVAAAALELDGGRWDHGACGAPGFGASRDAGAAAAERGRDVVQAGPQVRDGGVGLGDEGRAARGAGP